MNYLGIDVGGSAIKYALIDYTGSIVEKKQRVTPNDLTDFLETFSSIIQSYHDQIKGVGISLPGKIDTKKGVVYFGGALTYLHEYPLKKYIEETHGITCALSNDGKAAVLAEWWIGNLKDCSHGAVIVLGTGIGCGLILDNKLCQGSNFQAGEISFLANMAGELSLEQLIGVKGSAVGFVQSGAALLNMDDQYDGKTVFDELVKGENVALKKLFVDYCQLIARMIINLQVTLDLDKLVIGGGISAQPILIQEIKHQYRSVRKQLPLLEMNFKEISIEACLYGNEANLLGAVYNLLLSIEQRFS